MKKFLLYSIIAVLLMTGCSNQNNDIKQERVDNNNTIEENKTENNEMENNNEEKNSGDILELRGLKFKNINLIDNSTEEEKKTLFDNNLVYATPIKDGEDVYVKLSDNFFLNEAEEDSEEENSSRKNCPQIEMLPSKIYSSDEKSYYLYNYKNETYFIPVEKCNVGEERIVYRDYGLELIQKDDRIKIKDKEVSDVINGWDLRTTSNYKGELRYEDVSLCEAYMETWKINEDDMKSWSDLGVEEYISSRSDFTKIYEVDFDDDKESLEFIYASNVMEHINIDTTMEVYSIITYNKEYGIKNYVERMLGFNNILNYKNVFYGFDAFSSKPKIDNIILINENIITGYYIFDNEYGLVHVDRFANGERFDESGFEKLSKVELTLSGKHVIKPGNNINAFEMYDADFLRDENGYIVYDEDGNPKPNPDTKYIEAGTKISINYINEDGYMFRFKTKDGTEYTIDYYYT